MEDLGELLREGLPLFQLLYGGLCAGAQSVEEFLIDLIQLDRELVVFLESGHQRADRSPGELLEVVVPRRCDGLECEIEGGRERECELNVYVETRREVQS